jgi:6-phosphogluconolactonase
MRPCSRRPATVSSSSVTHHDAFNNDSPPRRPVRGLAFLIVIGVLLPVVSGQTAATRKSSRPHKTVLYAAVGPELTEYDLDGDKAALVQRGSVILPGAIQEGWLHPSLKYLYIAWSGGSKGSQHGITSFRIDPSSGSLTPNGQPASLPARPVFITTDMDGSHVLAAYPVPSGLTVHRILPDGTLGAQVQPAAALDFGVYAHQVRIDPSNRAVMLITRGNGPTPTKAEDPGAIKIFNYTDGALTNRASVAPGGGFGYQVRHLDFHPSGKWVFVTLERQNQMHVYRRTADGSLSANPLFVKSTFMESTPSRPGQAAASIHVHPNGKFVYVANRSMPGGENTIAVFSIDQQTGEPTLIQSADTRGYQPRTFTLDETGRFLVVANQSPQTVHSDSGATVVPASLALFRIRDDGKLDFVRKYDVETPIGRNLFWARFVPLP